MIRDMFLPACIVVCYVRNSWIGCEFTRSILSSVYIGKYSVLGFKGFSVHATTCI